MDIVSNCTLNDNTQDTTGWKPKASETFSVRKACEISKLRLEFKVPHPRANFILDHAHVAIDESIYICSSLIGTVYIPWFRERISKYNNRIALASTRKHRNSS
jgi:hypothetical protein